MSEHATAMEMELERSTVMEHERAEVAVNGAAAGALLSASIGALAMGFFALANEIGLFSAPAIYGPAGGASGRTTFAVAVWLIVWAVLHNRWKTQQVNAGRVLTISLVLIGLGILAAFPPVWHLLAG